MVWRALILSLAMGTAGLARAASPPMVQLDTHDSAALAKIMATMPKPEYPLAARARGVTGYGVFHIWFHQETGVPDHIDIVRSTGSKLLDDAAVAGLRRWRAKPGRVSHMKVPITFSMP